MAEAVAATSGHQQNARGRIAAFSGPSLALSRVLQHNVIGLGNATPIQPNGKRRRTARAAERNGGLWDLPTVLYYHDATPCASPHHTDWCNMTRDLRQGGRAAGVMEPAMRLQGIITWSKT
ncbi:hypothetical protein HaLaN_22083, partial [Haematococcus lacustris]